MILPNFANQPDPFCHLPWQLPVWQNSLADWQTFANHTTYDPDQYATKNGLVLMPRSSSLSLDLYRFHRATSAWSI